MISCDARIVTGSSCGTIKLQNEDNNVNEYISIPVFDQPVTAMCSVSENKVVACSANKVRLLGPELEVIQAFNGPDARTISVDMNGSWIGTSGEDNKVRIYQVVKDSLNPEPYKV